MDAARMIEERVGGDIAELASMVDPDQEGWSRVALTEVDVEGRQWALKQFRRLGLDARIDPAGNVIGCLQGAQLSWCDNSRNPAHASIMTSILLFSSAKNQTASASAVSDQEP